MPVARSFPVALLILFSAAVVGAQDSLHTTTVGRFDAYGSYSDIWGYETQAGRELAILGTQGGTSIIDVTDPATPVEKAFFPGPSSSWRDMKTHAGHAYIVTEGGGGGMQVIDLETDPPQIVTTYSDNFDTAHNIAISDGFAYIVGAELNGNFAGTRIVSLAIPTAPVEVGSFNAFYIHDCVVYNDTMYAAAISNDYLGVVDVTNKANPIVVKTFSWEGNNAHNCDLSTDGNYLFTTDEVTGGDLHVFDIRDLNDVQEVATYSANSSAIIHNVLVRGDLAFISYYTEGLRILDIANPEFPVEVGFYDTFPGVSGGFNGAWGVYPHTSSERIYVSDIGTGLYVMEFDLAWGAVEGTVSETGADPIAGAQVDIVGGNGTVTNSGGFYKVFGDPGAVTLATAAFGFEPDSSQAVLSEGSVATLDIALTRVPNGEMVGTVRSAADSMPVSSASVWLDGTPLIEASDGSGDYVFDHVPYGVYSARVSRFGFQPLQTTVTITSVIPPQEQRYDFMLEPAAVVEDFEGGNGGFVAGAQDDDATTGIWIWTDPVGSGGGVVQPEDDHSDPGAICWVTGNASSPTANIGENDVDGGKTTLRSPLLDTSGFANPTLSYWRWFVNDAGNPIPPDTFRVDVSDNAGGDWVAVERITESAQWTQVIVQLNDFITPSTLTLIRFVAEDVDVGSIVEAAIDDIMLYDGTVTDLAAPALGTRLLPNLPNPFNPRTTLRFQLAAPGAVTLRIYDVRGRLVRRLGPTWRAAGLHQQVWSGDDDRGRRVASGVYLYEMLAPGVRDRRRMLLLK